MKHSEAAKLVRILLPITQKFRSDAKEYIEKVSPSTEKRIIDNILIDMYPWIFDDNKLIHALIVMNDRLDKEKQITGMEFYNLMTIFHRFEETATIAIEIAFNIKLPEPKIEWVKGWEME